MPSPLLLPPQPLQLEGQRLLLLPPPLQLQVMALFRLPPTAAVAAERGTAALTQVLPTMTMMLSLGC